MAKQIKDVYDQIIHMNVTQSAANTLTFAQVSIGMSLFDYAAFVISRIEYSPERNAFTELQVNGDFMEIGITGSNTIADLDFDRPEVYDRLSLNVNTYGTPANAELVYKPIIHDFATMAGGGKLIPAQNLYIGVNSGGFTAAKAATARVYFRVIPMNASDFIELVQQLRVLST